MFQLKNPLQRLEYLLTSLSQHILYIQIGIAAPESRLGQYVLLKGITQIIHSIVLRLCLAMIDTTGLSDSKDQWTKYLKFL